MKHSLKCEPNAHIDMPVVSVILPVYNVRDYLGECLASLRNQTLHEIEIICVDDASSDGSSEILQEISLLDDRMKVIALRENLGVSAARNQGLESARGKYIKIIDSDDLLHPSALKILVDEANAWDADIVFHDANLLHEHGEMESYPYHELHRELHEMTGHAAWWYLFKRELLRIHSGIHFPEGAHPHEDSTFSFMLFTFCKTWRHIPQALLDYRQHDGMIMRQVSTTKRQQQQESAEICIAALCDFYQELPPRLARMRRTPFVDLCMLFSLHGRVHKLPPNVRKKLRQMTFSRFIYRKKLTKSGNVIVKVCGIPVWHANKPDHTV